MSYTGTQVYFPSDLSAAVLAAALVEQFASVTIESIPGDHFRVTLDEHALRLARDAGSHLPEEAVWVGRAAPAATQKALARMTVRYEIVPDDPRVDPDDVYNALLMTFEALRGLPGAIGHDPFDGSLFHQAAPAKKPVAKRKPTAKKKPAATKKPAAKNKPAAKKKSAARNKRTKR